MTATSAHVAGQQPNVRPWRRAGGQPLPSRPDTTMVVNLLLFMVAMAVVIGAAAYQHRLTVRFAATNRFLADRDK